MSVSKIFAVITSCTRPIVEPWDFPEDKRRHSTEPEHMHLANAKDWGCWYGQGSVHLVKIQVREVSEIFVPNLRRVSQFSGYRETLLLTSIDTLPINCSADTIKMPKNNQPTLIRGGKREAEGKEYTSTTMAQKLNRQLNKQQAYYTFFTDFHAKLKLATVNICDLRLILLCFLRI